MKEVATLAKWKICAKYDISRTTFCNVIKALPEDSAEQIEQKKRIKKLRKLSGKDLETVINAIETR